MKGAFTGAQSDRPGAFEAADGGMLFLDEVHRLSAEGQEKLFTWLDRGEIYRVGDTAQGHPVSVRLVFATTEEIHSTFLTTFLRRIPIQVNLPDLQHRSRQEKEALILLFSGRRRKTFGHAYPQTAFVADPQSVCLSRQRRRAEKCGEVCGGDGMGEKAWAGNRYRVAARSAGCHAVGIAVTE